MTALAAIAARVTAGGVLTADDAAAIMDAHDLITIGMMGDEVRRQLRGARTTFARVHEIHVDAVPGELPAGLRAGELRIVGRPASAEEACAAVRAVRRLAGGLPVSGFSLADLLPLTGDAPDLYTRLLQAGLELVSEVPIDTIEDLETAVITARAEGLVTPRLTVTAPPPDPVALLRRAMEVQERTGAFRAFAPLPRVTSPTEPTTGYDDVKMVAVARLLVRGVPSIQVDWVRYGPKLAQVALTVGADDVDGVAAADAQPFGHRRSAAEEIRRNIRAAGLEPVERDGRYDPIDPVGESPGEGAR